MPFRRKCINGCICGWYILYRPSEWTRCWYFDIHYIVMSFLPSLILIMHVLKVLPLIFNNLLNLMLKWWEQINFHGYDCQWFLLHTLISIFLLYPNLQSGGYIVIRVSVLPSVTQVVPSLILYSFNTTGRNWMRLLHVPIVLLLF